MNTVHPIIAVLIGLTLAAVMLWPAEAWPLVLLATAAALDVA